jgi:hypothetical protein
MARNESAAFMRGKMGECGTAQAQRNNAAHTKKAMVNNNGIPS